MWACKTTPPTEVQNSGLYMMATWVSGDFSSLSIDRYLPVTVGWRTENPVMLPPGRAMLATNPLPIGSDNSHEDDRGLLMSPF